MRKPNSKTIQQISNQLEGVRKFLVTYRHELTGVSQTKQLREIVSDVLEADLEAEKRLAPAIMETLWPGLPLLCEEAAHSGLQQKMEVLPWHDEITDLPDSYVALDGLDGSALYANGKLELVTILAGRLEYSIPADGLVVRLSDGDRFDTFTNNTVTKNGRPIGEWQEPKKPLKDCLVGLDDNKAVDKKFRELVISPLMASRNKEFRYPVNEPSGIGAIEVLEGKLAAYVTSNARCWDILATTALCKKAGLVVCCLDGSAIPWNQVRMPPVIFARDEEAYNTVRQVSHGFK